MTFLLEELHESCCSDAGFIETNSEAKKYLKINVELKTK